MDTPHRVPRGLFTRSAPFLLGLVAAMPLGCSSEGSKFDNGTGGGGGAESSTGGSDGLPGMAGSGSSPSTGGVGVGGGSQGSAGSGEGGTQTGGGASSAGAAPMGGQTSGGSGNGTAGSGGSGDPGPACPKPAGQFCHEFIANDNGRNQVNYVNEFTSTKPGGVVWSAPVGSTGANSPRTIEIVDNPKAAGGKAVLVSVNNGYVELDLSNGTKLAEVKTQFGNVTGACRMPDGTTALGVDNAGATGTPAQIRIVNSSGVQSRNFSLPAGANLRAINRNPADGHFWLSLTSTVYELSDTGQVLWQAQMGAGTKGYAVWWRAGGGAYGTTGEPHTIVEINATGQILQTIGQNDPSFEGLKLDFFSGFVRRPNGNFIVANWLGHNANPDPNAPEIIEFQPDGAKGKAVWTWGNQTLARQITNVYVFK
jgi:hypothetical protein